MNKHKRSRTWESPYLMDHTGIHGTAEILRWYTAEIVYQMTGVKNVKQTVTETQANSPLISIKVRTRVTNTVFIIL